MAAQQQQPVPEHDPWTGPEKDGLYDPQLEKEACGVGFIVAIDGKRTNKIVRDAQKLAMRMNHRGACSCDNDSGDGAGVLTAIPHSFYAHELREQENVDLPEEGKYATGMFYLDKAHHAESEEMFAAIGLECKIKVLCWRTVPVRNNQIGEVARSSEPFIRQAFVVDAAEVYDEDDFKRRVFALRKRSTHTIPKPGRRFYICSLSHTIVVYKGQFTSDQLWAYFTDLQSPDYETYTSTYTY